MKYAICTTFPLNYPTWREMLASLDMYWPQDVSVYIALDKVSEEEYNNALDEINKLMPSGRDFFVSNTWSDEKENFFKRNTDSPDLPYRFQVCKFSHKVFALYATLQALPNDVNYLIWLDADVIAHSQVKIQELMPKAGDFVSYLGRKDAPHSECSFMAFHINTDLDTEDGEAIISYMHAMYVDDSVLSLHGWTDCDVFDRVVKGYGRTNLSEDIPGWHVFPNTILGKYMEHKKGARKMQKNVQNKQESLVDFESMNIKTKNALDHELIRANILENMKHIKQWVSYVKPHDEPIVICSAGESLSYADIKLWYDKGAKIVTVKHAIDRLKSWDIKPWACVLLDPRPHVESFVKKPDKEVIYFVASMVDPSVVRSLLENDCKVVGYHAYVGAGEDKILPNGAMMVCGGSATATRCIGLLHECLGFKDIHCYGYDLCYYTKPDMAKTNEDGTPKYLELTLSANTWGGKKANRTFWTEGQFLAQSKELHDLYKTQNGFTIHLYGHGIAAWQQTHFKQYKAWVDNMNANIERKKLNSNSLDEWLYGIYGK